MSRIGREQDRHRILFVSSVLLSVLRVSRLVLYMFRMPLREILGITLWHCENAPVGGGHGAFQVKLYRVWFQFPRAKLDFCPHRNNNSQVPSWNSFCRISYWEKQVIFARGHIDSDFAIEPHTSRMPHRGFVARQIEGAGGGLQSGEPRTQLRPLSQAFWAGLPSRLRRRQHSFQLTWIECWERVGLCRYCIVKFFIKTTPYLISFAVSRFAH